MITLLVHVTYCDSAVDNCRTYKQHAAGTHTQQRGTFIFCEPNSVHLALVLAPLPVLSRPKTGTESQSPAARSPPWQMDALPPCRGTRGCAQHGPAGSSSVLAHGAPGSSVGGAWPQPPGPCTVPAQRRCLGGRRGTRNQTA